MNSLMKFLKSPISNENKESFHFLQDPEPETVIPEPEVKEEESLEYRNDGYIELVLKVMARMCDGQNHQLQVCNYQ